MSVHEHKSKAAKVVRFYIITVSDTRTKETDKSGRTMTDLLSEQGHAVNGYDIVVDDQAAIEGAIRSASARSDVDIILLNGGTGITRRDVTYEVVETLLEKELPGFGELFRMLSYTEDIGSAAMLSRAIAGTLSGKAVFSMPGSTGAVKLAVNRLILPEAGHIKSLLGS